MKKLKGQYKKAGVYEEVQREDMELELEKRDNGEELGCLKELNQNVMTGTSEVQIIMRNKIAGKWKRISRSFQKGNDLNNEEKKKNELVGNKRGMIDEGEYSL